MVEVKGFLDKSFFNDFHTCGGQYNNYIAGLQANKIVRKLFLAIPPEVYLDHFKNPFIIDLVIRYNMPIFGIPLLASGARQGRNQSAPPADTRQSSAG